MPRSIKLTSSEMFLSEIDRLTQLIAASSKGGVIVTTNANKPAGDPNRIWIPTDGTFQGIGHYWYNNAWVPMRSVAM